MLTVFVCSIDSRSGFPHVVDLVDQAQARQMAKGINAKVIRRRKDKAIVEVHLSSLGDDSNWNPEHPKANPRTYSHDHETPLNPRGCWTVRHLHSEDAPIYQAAVLDTLKRAA
jgi:hypothetical protein